MITFTVFVIVIAVIVLVSVYIFVYLIFNRKEAKINLQLSKLLNAINYKNDLLPGILQSLKNYHPERENFIKEIISLRNLSYETRTNIPLKRNAEKDLGIKVEEIFDIAKDYADFREDPTFVELRYNYSQTETKIDEETGKYNDFVEKYNKLRKYLVIFTFILRIKPLTAY